MHTYIRTSHISPAHTHTYKLHGVCSLLWKGIRICYAAIGWPTVCLATPMLRHTRILCCVRLASDRLQPFVNSFLCVSYGKFLVEWKWSNEYLCACTLTNFGVYAGTKIALAYMCVGVCIASNCSACGKQLEVEPDRVLLATLTILFGGDSRTYVCTYIHVFIEGLYV